MNAQDVLLAAVTHHRAGRRAEAEVLYRQVLAAQPNNADALHNLGLLALDAGRPDAAIDLIGRAISAKPDLGEAYNNLASALLAKNRFADAIAACRAAIKLRPQLPEAHNNLGFALGATGQTQEAIAACHAALSFRPQYPAAQNNLGNALAQAGQHEQAVSAFRQALALRPDLVEAFNNLGNSLATTNQLPDAAAALRQAVSLRPTYFEAWNNLANVLIRLDQPQDAIAAARRCVDQAPGFFDGWITLGLAQLALNDADAAIAAWRRAITIQPDAPLAHWNLGPALLMTGAFAEGWRECDWRWKLRKQQGIYRDFDRPRWDGADFAGRTILIHADQGFGDTIQFARYIPLLARRGAKVVLECEPALKRLMTSLPGVDQLIAQGDPLPPFDLHCPIATLPMFFETTADSIPAEIPYLTADPALVPLWRNRLAAVGGKGGAPGPKVGLAWAGRLIPNPRRSIPASALAPLTALPGIYFITLQKGAAAAPPHVIDWTADLQDFADTAALIANLDLVITIDTAISHLAGALAKPVWVLLPFAADWRWHLDRSDSPWYPTMRLFRQPAIGDWQTPVARVMQALRDFKTE